MRSLHPQRKEVRGLVRPARQGRPSSQIVAKRDSDSRTLSVPFWTWFMVREITSHTRKVLSLVVVPDE